MASQPLYHRNAVAGGPPVKGVECKRCGAYVGLVQSKRTGKWYTCRLLASMNPDSAAKVAYPFMPHGPDCRVTLRTRELDDAWSAAHEGADPWAPIGDRVPHYEHEAQARAEQRTNGPR